MRASTMCCQRPEAPALLRPLPARSCFTAELPMNPKWLYELFMLRTGQDRSGEFALSILSLAAVAKMMPGRAASICEKHSVNTNKPFDRRQSELDLSILYLYLARDEPTTTTTPSSFAFDDAAVLHLSGLPLTDASLALESAKSVFGIAGRAGPFGHTFINGHPHVRADAAAGPAGPGKCWLELDGGGAATTDLHAALAGRTVCPLFGPARAYDRADEAVEGAARVFVRLSGPRDRLPSSIPGGGGGGCVWVQTAEQSVAAVLPATWTGGEAEVRARLADMVDGCREWLVFRSPLQREECDAPADYSSDDDTESDVSGCGRMYCSGEDDEDDSSEQSSSDDSDSE